MLLALCGRAAAAPTEPSAPPLLPPVELPPVNRVVPTAVHATYSGAPPLGVHIGPRLMTGLRARVNGGDAGAAYDLDLSLAATIGVAPGDRPWLVRAELGYTLTAPPVEHLLSVGASAAVAKLRNGWSTAWILTFGPRFLVGQVQDLLALGFRYGATGEFETFNGACTTGLFAAAEVSHQVLFVAGEARNDLRFLLGTGLTFGSGGCR